MRSSIPLALLLATGAAIHAGPLPANNLLGVDAELIIPTVDDGIYLLLLPLSPGEHTIRFGSRVAVPAGVIGPDPYEFIQDVTYHITVAPRRR